MENPFMALGLLQEAQARARYHDDWEQDYRSFQEQSDRERLLRPMLSTLTTIAQFFRGTNRPALRATHA